MKKIKTYLNNEYLFTTTKYNTIKELKKELQEREGQKITIYSIPNKTHTIQNIKNYNFKIIKKILKQRERAKQSPFFYCLFEIWQKCAF